MSNQTPAKPGPSTATTDSAKPHDAMDHWLAAARKSAPGGNLEALNWNTPDGITVKPLYTAADIQDLPHTNSLPGFAP